MKNISHQLYQKETEKILKLTLNDTTMTSLSGKLNKLRKTEKFFSTPQEAIKAFTKKEWEAIKKGFNLHNENAKTGEPILHTYIGGGYTGALSFQHTPNGTYVYKNIEQTDYLILKDNLGITLEEVQLPEQLAWDIEYITKTNSLILNLDHYVYEYQIEKNKFNDLSDEKDNGDCFVSVSQDLIAYAKNDKIFIKNNQNNVLLSQSYQVNTTSDDYSFCGKLSSDGKLLAFHNKKGEIKVLNTKTGEVVNKIIGDFETIKQIEFTENNTLLVTKEDYGTWRMRYFNLTENKEIKIEGLKIPSYAPIVMNFCFNNDQSKLVIIDRTNVAYIFDFRKKEFLYSFKIQHAVQTSNAKFINETLAVRTDYGCFSIYNV
ncbi:WD40 repeat domain-containing protein [Algibacter sp. L3A6]|uniref:WD40 repeat domain-containing protein n=1 Tax=Algibacter sp. L3A6 TaxID=2686366 RepID=UPI00131D73D0|nr:WD40 repeat domain-containing protein [Algibacter sp. L3A6]